jgi:hypothetical protein
VIIMEICDGECLHPMVRTIKIEASIPSRYIVRFEPIIMSSNSYSKFLMFVALFLFGIGHAGKTHAAERYNKGDAVEVLFLGEWRSGVVLETNKQGLVKVEFAFAGSKVEVFKPDAVRHEYESGAIVRGRTWSDESGSFQVKAALLKIRPDTITLRRPDGKELEVPIAKLSEKDQKFLTQYRKQVGGGVVMAAPPEPIEFAIIETKERESKFGIPRRDQAASASDFQLAPDPVRASLQLSQAGVGFPRSDFHDFVSAVIPLGGKDNWVLASVDNTFSKNNEHPMRIGWASLSTSKLKTTHVFPSGEQVVDYHAASKQLMTYSQRGGRGFSDQESILTIWKTDPTATEAKGIVAWKARISKKERYSHAKPWARFATGEIVIQRDDDHNIVAWDTTKKSAIWTTAQASFFAPQPALSPNGKYLLLPEDEMLRILDPLSGDELGSVTTGSSCAAVGLHSDGKTIAILCREKLIVVDITQPKSMREIQSNALFALITPKIQWVNDRWIAIESPGGGFSLFSMDEGIMLWNYEFDAATGANNYFNPLASTIAAEHLVYSAHTDGMNGPFVVGAVRIPEDSVASKIANVRRKDVTLMGPGSRVRLNVQASENNIAVTNAATRKISENGWIADPNGEFTLEAKMYVGPSQTTQYGSIIGNQMVSVSISPHVSQYRILLGNEVVWQNSTVAGAPPMVHTQGGQSVQESVDRFNLPNVAFFSQAVVPDTVIDPKKSKGIGTSLVTNRGLVQKKP